ncbi:MAG: hypothetical protein EBX17_05875 [Betaproteobacteria bacterium]|nr:hypothetical protein [Betaproteobacteria bacterium]
MRATAPETVTLQTGRLRVVRRDGSRHWQVHFKIDGVKHWYRRSLETEDLEKATVKANRIWMKATFDHEDGRAIVSKRFKAVAETVKERLEAELEAGMGKPSYKDYISAIRLYLIPFYGNHNVDAITPAVVESFHRWRTVRLGRELSGSAQGNHNVAMNLVLDEAIKRGFLTEGQRPSLKNTGTVGDRRAEFSHAELEQIMAYFPTFIANSRAGRTQTIREVLALYVPFMAATGMRPGTEAEFLEWRHIDVEVRDGTPVLHFRIQRGKRGARNFVAHNSCWLILERLRQMVPAFAQMTLQEVLKKRIPRRLFCLPDGSLPESFNKPFKALLEEAKLLHCLVTGKERSLYSLRHYYATQRLLESVPISDLADQMGTSILMITKHYSHLTPLMKAKQFVGTVKDGHLGIDGATIRSLMAAQLANQNVMSLVHAGTGLTLPVRDHSPDLAKDLEARLDARLKART